MIHIKNGKYIGGNPEKVVCFDYDNGITEDWWDDMINHECWILEISMNPNKIEFYSAYENEVYFIPRSTEYDSIDYDKFWKSKEIVVFSCFEVGLKYISHYRGCHKTKVESLYKNILKNQLYDETYKKFSNLENFKNEIDVNFLNELEDFVNSKDLKLDSTLSTMKFLMLNRYKLRIEEQRLSCQN